MKGVSLRSGGDGEVHGGTGEVRADGLSGGRWQGYRDLIAWQKAMGLVRAIYEAARGRPRDEQFGLTAQVHRAAVSIPSNIAEGHGRSGPREFAHHLSIAYGSLCETETQLLIAGELAYNDPRTPDALLSQLADVRRLLRGLLRSVRSSVPSSTPRPPERSATP